MRLIAVIAVVVGLAATGALAWTAGELHYQNCLATATALHPVPVQDAVDVQLDVEPQQRAQAARLSAVKACSRLP